MFVGSLQDTVFMGGHLCARPWYTAESSLLAWWIKELEKITLDYAEESYSRNKNIGFWVTSCPGHVIIPG